MTRRLFRTTPVLVAGLTLLTAPVTVTTPGVATDDSTEAVGPGGLPGPAPDSVSSLLDVMGQVVEGELSGILGDEVSDVPGTGGG